MSQEIRIGKPGAVDEPVFQLILIIKPNEDRYKKRAGHQGRLIYLTVIRLYETNDFLHFRAAK
jgi:hypothetical protein